MSEKHFLNDEMIYYIKEEVCYEIFSFRKSAVFGDFGSTFYFETKIKAASDDTGKL